MIAYCKSHDSVLTDFKRNYFLLNKQLILRHRRKILTADAMKRRARKNRTRRMCDLIGFKIAMNKVHYKFAILRFEILI